MSKDLTGNAVLENIRNRRSIRHFTQQQVGAEELETVLEAGTWAPSGHGTQDNFIVAVQDAALCAELRKLNAAVMGTDSDPYYGAPTIVLVFSKEANEKNYQKDGALVLGTMMLAAASLGLGSCWINRCREMLELSQAAEQLESLGGQSVTQRLGIPEGYVGVGSLALGYPAHIPTHPKARKEDYYKVI